MIVDGVLENLLVLVMVVLYVYLEMEMGKIGFCEGLYMVSCDEVYIMIYGKGGYGVMLYMIIDFVVIGVEIIISLQQFVSWNCDLKIFCVLSFGYFEVLGVINVILEKVVIKGIFCIMDEVWCMKVFQLIEQ